MKRTVISLFIGLLALMAIVGCTSSEQPVKVEKDPGVSIDSLSVAIGKILAVDCYLNGLTDYQDQIDKAVWDIYNANRESVLNSYAYVNAVEKLSKSYAQVENQLDPNVILDVAHNFLADMAKDSASKVNVRVVEKEANDAIFYYVNNKFKEETAKFLDNVDHMEGIRRTESGLRYKLAKHGFGNIMDGEKVVVKYTLYDYNGLVLDSSRNFEVQVPDGVVPGFAEAIKLIGIGGSIKVWIPAELGYGNEGSGKTIAPGQVLVFDIEVLRKL